MQDKLRIIYNFTLFILITLFAPPGLSNQNASSESVILRSLLSSGAKKVLLEESLNGVKQSLQNFLQNTEISNQIVGPYSKECTPSSMIGMGLLEKWSKCPGIPDNLFSNGNYLNFNPRPVFLRLQNIKFEQINFAKIQVSCSANKCDVFIPLKEFVTSFDLEIKLFKQTTALSTNPNIFQFIPVKIRLGENTAGKMPYLKFRIASSPNNRIPLGFDTNKSSLLVPSGSLFIELPDNQHNIPIQNILDENRILSVNNQIVSRLLGFVSTINRDLANLYGLLDLNLNINQHFNDDSKIMYVNNLLNSKFFPVILDLANQFLTDSGILSERTFSFPNYALQDIFDQDKNIKFLNNFLLFLNSAEICNDDIFTSYIYEDLSLNQLMASLELSKNPFLEPYLTRIISDLQQIKKSFPNSRELVLSLNHYISAFGNIRLQIAKPASGPESPKIKLKIQEPNSNGSLDIKIIESLDNPIEEESVNMEPRYQGLDLNILVNFAAVNSLLKIAHAENKFNFCLSNNPLLTCKQAHDLDQNVSRFTFLDAPQIRWDPILKSHYLDSEMQIGEDISTFKIWVLPQTDTEGHLKILNKIEFKTPTNWEHLKSEIIIHFLQYIKSLHPWMSKFLFDSEPALDLESEDYNFSVEIPGLDIVKIDLAEHGIEFYGALNGQ